MAIDYFGIMFGIQNEYHLPDDTPVNFDEIQIQVNFNDEFNDGGQIQLDSNGRFDIEGVVTLVDNESITINLVMVTELENGMSVAVSNQVNPNLITINLLSDTEYSMKNIYDINGNKVDTGSAEKDDLQIDKIISIKGYERDDEFFATEIIINNFKF